MISCTMNLVGKLWMLVMLLALYSCANDGATTSKAKYYGHWKYKGSSTFEQRFQCVEQFMPRQNINCE